MYTRPCQMCGVVALAAMMAEEAENILTDKDNSKEEALEGKCPIKKWVYMSP